MLVDSHCHLADRAFDADREAVLARARGAGVAGLVVVADSLPGSVSAIALCRGAEGLAATAGIHPHQASSFDAAAPGRLEALAADAAVAAIGETGLDYHYDHSSRQKQREAFAWHLALAARLGKPAVIHSRDADQDTARLVADAPAGLTGVLHCFSAGREVLDAALERGLMVSFSGMITFRTWDQFWAVNAVPDQSLLIETDAPYLAPSPHRGRRNEPSYLPATASRLAELRGVEPGRIAQLTTANATRLFGLRLPDPAPGPRTTRP